MPTMASAIQAAPLRAGSPRGLAPARKTALPGREAAPRSQGRHHIFSVRSSSEAEAGPGPSGALPPPAKVFVAGATGATGQRVVRALLQRGIRVQAGVRSLDKAKSLLADAKADDLDLVCFDVLDDVGTLSAAIDPSVDAIIIATGFSPPQGGLPNPFLPWQVDCTGTMRIVDAARELGIKRMVLVTSILTNGAAWGQGLNPAYVGLNLFGLVLIAKLQAELYVQRSGINYTIVRPGGLRSDARRGNIVTSSQDTLSGGSVSRDSVAEVSVEALLWEDASFKIVELVEREDAPAKSFQQLFQSVEG